MKPKNFSEAIEDLEENKGESRLEREMKRIQETLENLKPHLDELGEKVGTEAKKARARVEKEVSDNPWAAIGIVGLVFFVIGFLFGSKGRRD